MAKLLTDVYGKDESDIVRSLASRKQGENGIEFREVISNASTQSEYKNSKLLFINKLNTDGRVANTRQIHSIRYVNNTNGVNENWAGGELEWRENADNIYAYAAKEHLIRGQNIVINGVGSTRIPSTNLYFDNIPYVSDGYDCLLAEKGKKIIRIHKAELGIPTTNTLIKPNFDPILWRYEGIDYGADFNNQHKYVAEINIGDLFSKHTFKATGGELFEVHLSARIKDTNSYGITNINLKMNNGIAWQFETWLTSPTTASGNTNFSYNGTNLFITPAYHTSSWSADSKMVLTIYAQEKIPFKNKPSTFSDQGGTSTLNVDELIKLILKK